MANTILIKSLYNAAGAPAHGSNLKIAELAVNTANDTGADGTGNRGHIFMGVTEEGGTENAAGSVSPSAYNADQTAGIVWVGAPILDEDNMASDDATKLATQQSIKKYVDDTVAGENTIAEMNDVTLTSVADGAMLLYDTGNSVWIDNIMSGDATMLDTGAVSIGATKVTGAMLNDDAISGQGAIGAAPANSDELLLSDGGVLKSLTIANLAANSSFSSGVPTTITVADTTDTTSFVGLWESATGDLAPKSDAGLTYNAGTGMLTATGLTGPLTGNASTATALANGRTISMTGDVAWTSASFDGSGNVTAAGTIQANAVEGSMLNTDVVSAQTALTSGLASTDELMVSDAGTLKRMDTSVLQTYMQSNLTFTTNTDADVSIANLTARLPQITESLTIGDATDVTVTMAGALTVTGDLIVNGATTTVDTATLRVEDPLIQMARNNTSTDVVDIGFFGTCGNAGAGNADSFAGLFRDASDSTWHLFDLLTAAPTTTVNVSGSGFNHAGLKVGALTADDASTFTTGLTTAAITATANIDIGSYDFQAATLSADGLTATRVVFAGSDGVLSDDSDMTFSGDTLTVTKLGAWEATGAINFDSEDMTNVDINSGDIAAVTMSGSHTWSAAQNFATGTTTVATIDCNGGAIDATTIGASSATTIVGTTITATTSNLGTLGSNVNHSNYNSTNVDINSGAIDGTTIGAASAAAGTFAAVVCTTLNTGGKLTAGSNEIEGSAFDINGGTVDAITSLTVANSVDIGNYTMTMNGLTIDGTFSDGTMTIAGGVLTDATINCGTYST